MTARYRFDPALSRLTVQAFATGLLSFLGHSPTFAVRGFAGGVSFEDSPAQGLHLELAVRADSLELVDQVKPADRREIETTMQHDVLETATFSEIGFRAEEATVERVEAGRYRVRFGGRLSLHGVTRSLPIATEFVVFSDGIRLRGESTLRLSDFRIKPVTAVGGTIRLKDELRVMFDIAGLPEAT
jgi:polyisoprenoid-binding protein YceI